MGAGIAALRYRPVWLAVGYVLVGLTAWFSLDNSPPRWAFVAGDKVLHAATYGLLVYWFGQLYPGARRRVGVVIAFVAFGGLMELFQAWFTVVRDPQIGDFVADTVGTLTALGLLATPAGRLIECIDGWLSPGR